MLYGVECVVSTDGYRWYNCEKQKTNTLNFSLRKQRREQCFVAVVI